MPFHDTRYCKGSSWHNVIPIKSIYLQVPWILGLALNHYMLSWTNFYCNRYPMEFCCLLSPNSNAEIPTFSYHTHGMMTSSNENICRVTGHLCGEFTGQKGQWCGALMFSLICVWINGWVNNREAGDLRRYRAHYDVIVMASWLHYICSNLIIMNGIMSKWVLPEYVWMWKTASQRPSYY